MRGNPWTLRNALVLPIAILVRAPLVIAGMIFLWIGGKLEAIGHAVPGLEK